MYLFAYLQIWIVNYWLWRKNVFTLIRKNAAYSDMPINKKASTIIRLSMLSSSRGDWIRTSDHTPPRLWYLLHGNHWLSDFSVISLCFGLIYGLIRQWTKMFDNKLIFSCSLTLHHKVIQYSFLMQQITSIIKMIPVTFFSILWCWI